MFPFFFDWTMVLLLPAMALAFWAQIKVKSTYHRYSEIQSRSRMTGQQAARRILDANGLGDVRVEAVAGALTDHYDPRTKVVALSEPVYGSNSLAALAVAAHETGHAVQHQTGYPALALRARLVPVAALGSNLAIPLFLIGLMIPSISWMMDLGILFFSAAVVFHLVTLPVEFDASARAIRVLANGYLAEDEVKGAKKVLSAAAWTYIAAASVALLQLVRLLLIRQSRD